MLSPFFVVIARKTASDLYQNIINIYYQNILEIVRVILEIRQKQIYQYAICCSPQHLIACNFIEIESTILIW